MFFAVILEIFIPKKKARKDEMNMVEIIKES